MKVVIDLEVLGRAKEGGGSYFAHLAVLSWILLNEIVNFLFIVI